MSVIRVQKNKNFTVMSNTHLFDKNLSLKAAGLLSKILALPDNWNYSIKGLCAICKESETAVKSALNELRDNRYVIVERIDPSSETGGRIQYEYFVYEQPQGEENKKIDVKEAYRAKQGAEKQSTEKQGVENLGVECLPIENLGDILNTNISNTNKLNTKGLNTDKLNTDIISPTELNTNKFASSPTGLHTSLSDERKARGESKYKWVATKNHIVSVMDKLGYGELADETQSAIEVFRYYYMMYKQKTGKAHPILNDKAMTDTLVNFIDSLSEIEFIDCDDYECMIDEHFSNNYGKEIDYSIRHFMNIGILKKLYKRLI